MIAKILTAGRPGFNSALITVEADILPGIPNLAIVGLPDHAVRESRDRIRSAITNAGFNFPVRNIVINLSPNDTPKEGGLIEAAMATALLVASGQLPQDAFRGTAILGALSLDGSLTSARGIAAAAIFAAAQPAVERIIIPETETNAVTTPKTIAVFSLQSLRDLPLFAHGGLEARTGHLYEPDEIHPEISMEQIFGLAAAKRALAVAAVGRHHVLMVGSPGSGKSLLARAYRHLLPPLTFDEAAEATQIYSLAGLTEGELIRSRPFRSPHHTTSTPALVGGSTTAKPGEISLAHHGTLFLDELPEFRNEALQSLREPLEDKKITIARARGHITYPADFQLVAAANPCRCGKLFAPEMQCDCPSRTSLLQFSKIVGPFLDRIAIEVNLNDFPQIPGPEKNYTTVELAEKIIAARERSRRENSGLLNNGMEAAALYKIFSSLNPSRIYESYAQSERLSMRSWLNILRVAKSIADFDGVAVHELCIREALQYRFVRKMLESKKQQQLAA
jgi:magnesium chelatase family protein